jgi:thiol-disulfide isomerase/thioredoxin
MSPVCKRLFALVLSLLSAVVFAACSGAASAPTPAAPATETSTPAPVTTVAQQKPATALDPSQEMEVGLGSADVVPAPTGDEKTVPEIQGITSWINSEPLTFEKQRGKVVLVDFWTYTCVNCIRTLPYLKAWHDRYADKGLVIVAIHSPEFEFEKDRDNVVDAVAEFGIKYPVAQDNDFETWRAFNNRYWPAKYLVDKDGLIRYTHFGEGAYAQTEEWIRGLLAETGADLSDIPPDTRPEPVPDSNALNADPQQALTRELYAGYERNYGTLLARSTPYILQEKYYEEQDVAIEYTDPGDHKNHYLYLQGLWLNEPERIVHARETTNYEDYLAVKFYATSVNAVMAPMNGSTVHVRVTVDDAPVPNEAAGADVMFDDAGNSYIAVDEERMYNILNLPEFGGHELKLSSNSPDFSLFAYTFGAYQGGEPAKTGPNS